jgi:homogentisate 1,2-dioxygenase
VQDRASLLENVIPFFERNPLLSSKQADFEKFAEVVRGMALDHHRTAAGFDRLLEIALSMNGGGRYRKVRWKELVAAQNPQRLYAEPGSTRPEDTVRAVWRHAESGRNDLALEPQARE